jgi:hypothetical protein
MEDERWSGLDSGYQAVEAENAVHVEAATTVFLLASRVKIPVGLEGLLCGP